MQTKGSGFLSRLRTVVGSCVIEREPPSARCDESDCSSGYRCWCSPRFLRCALPLGAVALISYPLSALSQVAPSQVTPQTLRPAAPNAPAGLPPSGGAQLQAPAGAERLSAIVGHVTIEWSFPEIESETRSLVHAVEGHSVSVAQIYEFANAHGSSGSGFALANFAADPDAPTCTPAGVLQSLNRYGRVDLTGGNAAPCKRSFLQVR